MPRATVPDPCTPPPVPPAPDALRAQLSALDMEGALRILHLSATGAIVHVTPVAEGAHSAEVLFARYLAELVAGVGSAAAVLVVHRREGRPSRTDKALWLAVHERLATASTTLLDLIVLGADRHWSAVSDARRSAARKSASRAAAR
jgi:DNA repair protein RadC